MRVRERPESHETHDFQIEESEPVVDAKRIIVQKPGK